MSANQSRPPAPQATGESDAQYGDRRARDARGRFHPSRLVLHSRIAVALLIVGALLVGVVAVSAFLQVQTRQQQREVVFQYYNALRLSQNYYINLLNSETAVRGYALSHQESTLQPLTDAGRPWDDDLVGQVGQFLPGRTDSLRQLAGVQAAAASWYADWAAPAIAKVRSGQELTPADITAGKESFDRIRVQYQSYMVSLRSGRDETANHLRTLTDRLFAAVLLSALIAVFGALMLWVLLRRWVSGPIARLGAETRLVTEGDLTHRVVIDGPPDITRLGRDVEGMRERLVALIAVAEASESQIERARSALEQQTEELQSSNRDLQQARSVLEEQTEELQRSNRELEQFAYVASHDLQEPLRKVTSFCQMLQRRYGGQLDDRADQYIHFAVDGAKRMQQLINDLLEFSRVGRLTTPQTDVDLNACLRLAMGNVETAIEESGATVTVDELPTVRGEAPLLTQLLQNVIGNAVKFRSEAPPEIDLGVRREGDHWEFWCHDNGIGIAPEYADRVFLIFQRLHPKEEYSGTGIGLAMGKKIVEYHGGRIWIDPASEGGATVRWTLPVIGTESSGPAAPALSGQA
jgi:signal transduction histidine kinase